MRADGRRELDDATLVELESLVARRERREPLAYVLGEWGFRRLTLTVDARVLVPRPETEIVVERCLARIAGISEPRVLDVGTGSGAIALAIADEHPGAKVTATDVSTHALEVARGERLPDGARGRAPPARPLRRAAGGTVGPGRLEPAVCPSGRDRDSRAGGARVGAARRARRRSGATEAIAHAAARVLRPGGWLVLETAAGSASRVADVLRSLRYDDVQETTDLAGRDRVVEGSKPS